MLYFRSLAQFCLNLFTLCQIFCPRMVYLVIKGIFMTELWKIIKEHAPPIMESNSNGRSITYNFRKLQEFQSEKERTVFYGLETLSHKQRNTGNLFKSDIKQWISKKRPFRLCKVFVPKLGFIWHMALSWYCLWFEL